MNKPSIIAVIGERVELRHAGSAGGEYKGLCPFHLEKTPSFSVNEEKGLFHCWGCGEAGDVITFVRKIDGLTFRQALAYLGLNHADAVRSPKNDRIRTAAAEISRWADRQTDRADYLLRQVSQNLEIANQIGWPDEQEICEREWAILSDLADDLQTAKLVCELYQNRAHVESLLAEAEEDTPEHFPALTHEYRAYLREHLPKVDA